MCLAYAMKNISKAERRQIENEMIFRRMNEKVGDDIDALNAMYLEDGDEDLISDADILIRFKCECSDENCAYRLPMTLSEYQEAHMDRDSFTVKPHHQVDPIEKVIKESDIYNIVKKNNSTPEPNDTLKITTIDNS